MLQKKTSKRTQLKLKAFKEKTYLQNTFVYTNINDHTNVMKIKSWQIFVEIKILVKDQKNVSSAHEFLNCYRSIYI